MGLVTEEDIKLKIVVPFLSRLGITDDELSYEQSFTIRVGTTEHTIGAGKGPYDLAHGRLDILVRRGGDNLFVVETKAPDIALEDNDVAQAVSYARLVHPIAPYCILTNGDETRLIDTVTRLDVALEALGPMPRGYRPSLDDDLRHEAVRLFLGYSRTNLLAFCRQQVGSYMEVLRASDLSPGERSKKYVPALYEPLSDAGPYERFTHSKEPCFVIVGESGTGKTCWLCHQTLARLETGEPTLFYRAHDIRRGVLAALGEDLNWELSPNLPDQTAARRFFEIFEDSGVTIFVDGIDEPGTSEMGQLLDEFLRRVRGRPGIRLVATCKAATWPRMLERAGHRTVLAGAVFHDGKQPGVTVTDLNDGQLARLIERYRFVYGIDARIESRLHQDFKRSPFLIRAAFEAAATSGAEVLASTSHDLYKRYLDAAMSPADDDKLREERFLMKIAQHLYDANAEFADEEELRMAIGLTSPNDLIPPRLFECNILVRQSAEGLSEIGFYFDRVRDYIIAFRTPRWRRLSPSDVPGVLSDAAEGVRRSALELFFTLASSDLRAMLAGPAYHEALSYVTTYESILREHFGPFAHEFAPRTTGEIGFLGYLDISTQRIGMHGFRPVPPGGEKVVLLPDWRGYGTADNRAFLAGASSLHSVGRAGPGSFGGDASVFRDEILESLRDAVKRGALDESVCPDMIAERVAALAGTHFREALAIGLASGPFQRTLVPLGRVREVVLQRRNFRALRHGLTERRIASGAIVPEWSGAIQVVVVKGLTPAEERALRAEAAEAAVRGHAMTPGSPSKDDAVELLMLGDVATLEEAGIGNVDVPWSFWKPWPWTPSPAETASLVEQTNGFVATLLRRSFDCFSRLVEHNFPSLSASILGRERQQTLCLYAVRINGCQTEVYAWWCDGDEPGLTLRRVESDDVLNDFDRMTVSIAGQARPFWDISRTVYQTGWPGSTSSSFMPVEADSHFCALRGLVYGRLSERLPHALEDLADRYGLSREVVRRRPFDR